jgi:asparagine synthase (glutamine-hydrolysing)
MCGITGFINQQANQGEQALTAVAADMAVTLRHRGPDTSGCWVDEVCGVALGFRRLAVLDLTPSGDQPMLSVDGRYVLVFNGEIYNFRELREELAAAGHHFRGTSDTEVLLAGLVSWGLEKTLTRINGMYAFAVWDREMRQLILVRDRIGIKPLYYGWNSDTFLFGSELKALRAHPAFHSVVDRGALGLFLRHDYIPAPHSIYQGIFKLMPGTYVRISLDAPQALPEPVPYWSNRAAVEHGVREPFPGDEEEALEALDRLLRNSVKERMIADVPLGAFLSGGIDSSLIVALMQAQSRRPVKTFTIGFWEPDFDEAPHARSVAAHLGTEHTELYVTPADALGVIPQLPAYYDEPFGDSSQIPTYLVSKLARQHVTVSLSGDGGDELFAGYNRYFWHARVRRSQKRIPAALRPALSRAIAGVSPAGWQNLRRMAGPVLPERARQPLFEDKIYKLAGVIDSADDLDMYRRLISHWRNPAEVVPGWQEPSTLISDVNRHARVPDFVQQMMYLDAGAYLPDDLLVKVDRASMAVSLEVRVPYLDDHRVVEFAWTLPLDLKIRNSQGKWILRRLLSRYVPAQIFERPKRGFAVPIDRWLRKDLKDWAAALIDPHRLVREGFLDPRPVQKLWGEHQSGKRDWQYHLWNILMFQAWLEHQK